jgi:hypothetical protein
MTFSPVCLVCGHFDMNNDNYPPLVMAAASYKMVTVVSDSINCDTLSFRVI